MDRFAYITTLQEIHEAYQILKRIAIVHKDRFKRTAQKTVHIIKVSLQDIYIQNLPFISGIQYSYSKAKRKEKETKSR